jgi:hypothetical protein
MLWVRDKGAGIVPTCCIACAVDAVLAKAGISNPAQGGAVAMAAAASAAAAAADVFPS